MKTVQGSSTPAANAAIMLVHSISSPGEAFIIELPPPESLMAKANKGRKVGERSIALDAAPRPKRQIIVSSLFAWVILFVFVITILAGGAQIWLAQRWLQPTPNEQNAYEAMASVCKLGFGALLGLLGGKNIR
jgi:hypothetical protein